MKKILIIEDHLENRENFTEAFLLFGFDVYTASNGQEGMELIQLIQPDIIICDILLPIYNGFEILDYTKKNLFKKFLFVFASAKAESKDVREGLEIGADAYLIKPFSPTQLYKTILEKFQMNHLSLAL